MLGTLLFSIILAKGMHFLELRVPPLLLTLLYAIAMWGLSRLLPTLVMGLQPATWLGAVIAAIGITVSLAGVASFRRARTTVDPMRPEQASALVTSGIFSWSRNPMYVGFLLVLIGWAVALDSLAAIVFALTFILYINRWQIAPEERMLRSNFGSAFEAYAGRTRRWV